MKELQILPPLVVFDHFDAIVGQLALIVKVGLLATVAVVDQTDDDSLDEGAEKVIGIAFSSFAEIQRGLQELF